MNAHTPAMTRLTVKQQAALTEAIEIERTRMREEMRKDRAKNELDIARRVVILAAFVSWQTFHIGKDRMPIYLEEMDKFADKALHNDTWMDETCAAMKRKLGIEFEL